MTSTNGAEGVRNPRGQWLYRAWDDYGRLLYVGVSVDPAIRIRQHRTGDGSHWHGAMREWRAEWYPTEELAQCAEVIAIGTEGPLHNLAGNPRLAWYRKVEPPCWEWRRVYGGPEASERDLAETRAPYVEPTYGWELDDQHWRLEDVPTPELVYAGY